MVKSQMIFHGLQFSKQLLSIFLPPTWKSTWARCYLCRQELFATRDEHPQAWPGTGGYRPDQVQLLLFHTTDGKVHVHHTPDCFSIFNCLTLFNSKKTTDTFFVVVVAVREHCLLVKEENRKTLDVFLQTYFI